MNEKTKNMVVALIVLAVIILGAYYFMGARDAQTPDEFDLEDDAMLVPDENDLEGQATVDIEVSGDGEVEE